MKASIPDINALLTDKFIRSTQNEDNRSLNKFIFLGDVAIGAYCTDVLNKDIILRAFCILPAFRNFGFGSRLLVFLIKNAVKRRELNTLSVYVDDANAKGKAFFARFGFEAKKPQNQKGKGKEEKKDEEETNGGAAAKATPIKMRLDLRLFRQSVLVLVKKQIKADASKSK